MSYSTYSLSSPEAARSPVQSLFLRSSQGHSGESTDRGAEPRGMWDSEPTCSWEGRMRELSSEQHLAYVGGGRDDGGTLQAGAWHKTVIGVIQGEFTKGLFTKVGAECRESGG